METTTPFSEEQGEIIIYEPNESLKISVRVEDETVWLSQAQMAELFQTTKQNISLHINNIFKEEELEQKGTVKDYLTVQKEGSRTVGRSVVYYNLDVIISIGYRVKSLIGTRFRQWANQILKQYLLKGYAIHQRFEHLEQRVSKTEEKIDFFVNTSLPKNEGIFYNGQIFDAYIFVTKLIKLAKHRLILIDNYIDETVLTMLSQRNKGVQATLYTEKISQAFHLAIQKHNAQYPPIDIKVCKYVHDRFLIIDEDIYLIGSSIKDVGHKMFGFAKMTTIEVQELLDMLGRNNS